MNYSRLNEDDVIIKLVDEIKPWCVDIGASFGPTGWSNVWKLVERGWNALLIECDPEKFEKLQEACKPFPNARPVKEKVCPLNLWSLISEVPTSFEVLSIDIDGYDLIVLHELLKTHRPRVICCEINAMIPPPIRFAVRHDPAYWWGNNTFFGMSIQAVHDLLSNSGYRLREVVYDNAIYSVHGEGRDVFEAWESGFLNAQPQEFGHQVARNLMSMQQDYALQYIRDMWKEYEGKYDLWI